MRRTQNLDNVRAGFLYLRNSCVNSSPLLIVILLLPLHSNISRILASTFVHCYLHLMWSFTRKGHGFADFIQIYLNCPFNVASAFLEIFVHLLVDGILQQPQEWVENRNLSAMVSATHNCPLPFFVPKFVRPTDLQTPPYSVHRFVQQPSSGPLPYTAAYENKWVCLYVCVTSVCLSVKSLKYKKIRFM